MLRPSSKLEGTYIYRDLICNEPLATHISLKKTSSRAPSIFAHRNNQVMGKSSYEDIECLCSDSENAEWGG